LAAGARHGAQAHQHHQQLGSKYHDGTPPCPNRRHSWPRLFRLASANRSLSGSDPLAMAIAGIVTTWGIVVPFAPVDFAAAAPASQEPATQATADAVVAIKQATWLAATTDPLAATAGVAAGTL